ncbi:alkyl sulfatase dimerization domain-containing protein [Mycolicibacterium austroafricanum]|uniref:alkyl sulfatase dimerization domain-containing protein n=1 Tax=Mycolicibacterium austroafricanum TaxID=39687 RepID=UPI00056C77CE|nr:alkyl sulfatase dimerization domain-containing protein [Mycolicibacterium austroafricanum]
MSNPYDVERSWPDYFLEHRRMTVERHGTYRCADLPVWTVYCPGELLGNSVFIEGDDGLIVYDTGVNMAAGRIIAEEIKKVTDKPVKAAFYSHHHADHYSGTSAIVEPADVESGKVDIYAWQNFNPERENEFGELIARQSMGAGYYGGAFLPPEDRHHHGIGCLPAGGETGFVAPTKFLAEDTSLTIAGVRMEIFYTGGEAISEFGIHLPDLDLVIIADEFFTGIPNLHSIRGSKPRVPDNYLGAMNRVLDIRPEWLLGTHIIPIQGKDAIAEHVTKYSDAVRYLWDQSIRLINKGYTPVELQHALKDLPEEILDPPFTVPMYGTPFTAVPEFYTGWVSWFSGDATDLFPAPPAQKSTRLAELMGGVDKVLDAAKADHSAGNHQMAAELAQIALRADPDNQDAKLVKAAALRARGYQEINPIARSWYLTGALELEGAVDPGMILQAFGAMLAVGQSTCDIARGWRYQLDADKAAGTTVAVGVRDAGSGEELTVRVRHRVLLLEDGIADDADVVLEATAADLRPGGNPKVVAGDAAAWTTLQSLLDTEPTPFYMHMR